MAILLCGLVALAPLWAAEPLVPPTAAAPLRVPVIGSYSNLRLYEQLEVGFWRGQLPRLTGGAMQAEIVLFDTSGIRGEDMLHLLRLGVVPFGTVLLGLAASDEPELAAPNLALLAPDLGTLRRMVQAYRPYLAAVLRRHYQIELLAIYAYPAQVVFCVAPLPQLEALRGRRVRVSQSSQADMVAALGGVPLLTPFARLREDMRDGRLDCAITGSSSGNQLGLHRMAAQLHGMPINWGLSIFVANAEAWAALPAPLQPVLRRGLVGLEQEVWAAAAQDTEDGFLCSAGRAECRGGTRGTLHWEPPPPEDEAVRRRLLAEVIVPGWIDRCGEECREAWNTHLAPMTRIFIPAADGALPPAGQPGAGVPNAGMPNAGMPNAGMPSAGVPSAGMPYATARGAGSQGSTGGLPASMIAPAASSTSSR